MTTVETGLRRRIEAINQMNNFVFGGCNIAQDAHELGAGKVAYFATPKALHPLHGQVFKEQLIVLSGQFMRQLEEPVTTLVDHGLVDASDNHTGFLPTTGILDLTRKTLLGGLQFSHCLPKVQRRFNRLPIVADEESLQTKIKACAVTRHGLIALVDFFLDNEVEPEIAQRIPLDRHRLDVLWNVPALAVLVDLALDVDPVSTEQLPARLLEREGTVLLDLLKTWWRSPDLALEVAKEQLIRLVDALYDVLDGLAANKIPVGIARELLELGEMPHQVVLAQTFAGQAIVPAMQGNTMVVDQPGDVYLLMQAPILFRPVELELVRLDDLHFESGLVPGWQGDQ